MKRVLIAGCGYVGSELARRLVARGGYEVIGLRRKPAAAAAGVTSIACDLADSSATSAALAALSAPLDGVIYAVGADAHTVEAYESAYIRSLANLIDALDACGLGLPRLVTVSSTAVYAQNDGEWVDELSPTEPTEFSGKILLESEALTRGRRGVVVRFGGIYGPGRHRFVDSVRNGTIRLSDGPDFTNRVHRDDCAEVLRHLLELEAPDSIYVGVDDEPADRRAVAAWMAERLGVDLATSTAAANTPCKPRGKRCSNARLRRSGYAFLYPSFREGYNLAMSTLGN